MNTLGVGIETRTIREKGADAKKVSSTVLMEWVRYCLLDEAVSDTLPRRNQWDGSSERMRLGDLSHAQLCQSPVDDDFGERRLISRYDCRWEGAHLSFKLDISDA